MDGGQERLCEDETGENKERIKKDVEKIQKSEYIYSKEKLLDLGESPVVKIRPFCLSKEFFNSDGFWDPERWFRSINGSRGNSPLTIIDTRDRKRPPDIDKDQLYRRRPSDPKERLKEERDGIILSPQRRSFGTGCHVTIGRQISYPETERERERRDQRRIGSGRLQLDRDREKERERDFRGVRGSYDRDDRRYDNRDDRTFDRRDFGKRIFTRSGERRISRPDEEEPEWFTSGPTSQADTIELHGFDHHNRRDELEKEAEEEEQPVASDGVEGKYYEQGPRDRKSSLSVGDRNGSLETNESSSPENNHHSDAEVGRMNSPSQFNFDEFFNTQHIPGLNDVPVETELPVGVSRFSQWFRPDGSHHNSQENSRRSSLTDDFGYLNDILSGAKSPVIPSPPPNTAAITAYCDKSLFFTPSVVGPDAKNTRETLAQQKSNINNVLSSLFPNSSINISTDSPKFPSRTNTPLNFSTQDAEAQLKAMLFGGKNGSTTSSGTASPAPGSLAGKVKTVAELEADVRKSVTIARCSPVPRRDSPEGDLTAFNKLLTLMKAGAAAASSPDASRVPSPPVLPSRSMSPLQQAALLNAQSNSKFYQALLHNKEQQRVIQQQTLQSLQQVRLQHQLQTLHSQQQTPSPEPINPNTPQATQQDPVLNFIKQNPTIIAKVASPTPPPSMNLQNTSTPRIPSPLPHQILQQNLLQQQPPSPRAPSPIMFSQQPPMHLNAPSPIHPVQLSRASPVPQNLSPNQLTTADSIRPPMVPRGPSPQELIAHTQAIMQNALIKKQLEEQKERFLRKQHDRVKSPNPIQGNPVYTPTFSQTFQATNPAGQSKPTVSVAFTPTSVIRRMHSDKLTEQERRAKEDGNGSDEEMHNEERLKEFQENLQSPEHNTSHDRGSRESVAESSQNLLHHLGNVSGESPSLKPSPEHLKGPTDSQFQASGMPHPILGQGMQAKMPPPTMSLMQQAQNLVQSNGYPQDMQNSMPPPQINQMNSVQFSASQQVPRYPNPALPSMNQIDKSKRALIGQGRMQAMVPVEVQTVSGPLSTSGRPIFKVASNPPLNNTPKPIVGAQQTPRLEQSHRAIIGSSAQTPDVLKNLTPPQMQQPVRPMSATSVAQRSLAVTPTPVGIPITGRMPVPGSVAGTPVPVPPMLGTPVGGTPVPAPVHPANAFLMQQMLQPGMSPAIRVNAMNQINQMNQLAAIQAQAQQRFTDPRLQNIRGVYPAVPPVITPRSSVAAGNIGFGTPGNPVMTNTYNKNLSPQVSTAHITAVNGPVSPSGGMNINRMNPASFNGNNNMTKQGEQNHLLKWFGGEVLKGQLPNLPPLPSQGQKVMTVDEIEQC